MDYIEVKFKVDKNGEIISDILSAKLAEIGFESFVANEDGMLAYIEKDSYQEAIIKPIIESIPVEGSIVFEAVVISGKNWNEEWEKNYFEPIVIGNECVISSSFHKNVPEAKYNITIDPKMSFGTGHHETTSLVISELLSINLAGKSLLDMGCGTCVLAILASMRGANPVTAIDIDKWCYENSIENLKLNEISNIEILLGDSSLLASKKFDIILANINRNILLNDIKVYANCLPNNGLLIMSGFYESDLPAIEEECGRNDLQLISYDKKNNWVVTNFVKK